MNWLNSIRSALGLSARERDRERPVKALGQAERGGDATHPTVELLVWVLVDEEGRYVADADPENLSDEYRYQVGEISLSRPMQVVKLTTTVPLPRPIEMMAGVVGG